MLRQFLMSAVAATVISNMTLADTVDLYDEDAVNSILVESDPVISYLVRLRMMKAHLRASLAMLNAGNLEEAREHVAHPRTEIFPDLEPELKKQKVTGFSEKMYAAEQAFQAGELDRATEGVETLMAAIADAETAAASDLDGTDKMIDVACMLLRSAVVEYKEAFEYNRLSNLVEYHDGSFFVQEASAILDTVAPEMRQRDQKAWTKIEASLKQLQTAWPTEAPPAKRILQVTKMQALVSIIDLQLGKLVR